MSSETTIGSGLRLRAGTRWFGILTMGAIVAACGGGQGSSEGALDQAASAGADSQAAAVSLSNGPNSSGPIQLSKDDKFAWVVNPDVNTVSAINMALATPAKVFEVGVGKEPRNVALSPDGKTVVVSNSGADTLSIFKTADLPHPSVLTIKVGSEPYGIAFTPNGKFLYVANSRSNTVSVLDPKDWHLIKTVNGVGNEPRGLAITNDGDALDNDEKVYATQFLGVARPGALVGSDTYKEGHVAVIRTNNHTVLKQAVLNPIEDTGFKSNGSALKRIAPDPALPVGQGNVVTGAFPNMMQSVVIKGNRAYLPNTCPSPDGPILFNVNVQSCLSVLNTTTDTEGKVGSVFQTINMNRGINFEVADPNNELKRLFLAVPWALAFKHNKSEGFAVSMSSNVIVKVKLDANGTPTINAPLAAGDPGAIKRILVGQGPRGIVINSTDTRAYVANENSRDVSIINLTTETEIARVASANLPAKGSEAAKLAIGKSMFDSSTGVDLPQLSTPQLSGVVSRFPARLSKEGWSSCFACHGFGKTDGVTWIFATGPRRSSPLNWSFNPKDAKDLKCLNHSCLNDNFQDFENNMRDVSGGLGVIVNADGSQAGGPDGTQQPGATKPPLTVDNSGRSAQQDALALWAAKRITTPLSPTGAVPGNTALGQQIARGRALFAAANCATCHGGAGWASSRVNLLGGVSNLTVALDEGVAVGQEALFKVNTFNKNAANEIKANGTTAAGALGFNPPSLLGAFGLAPYLHNGSQPTIDKVMQLKAHRVAGLPPGAPDPFADPAKRKDITAFVESIDTRTAPFPIPAAAAAAPQVPAAAQ
jgi:YVTN family beta-propeller protein